MTGKAANPQVLERRFAPAILIGTFVIMAVWTTVQMVILGEYIRYERIARGHVIAIVAFWLLTAAAFMFITTYQINRRYEKPMRRFAQATRQVANGDFSVYVKPRRTDKKMDYLDAMFLDFNTMVEELGGIETLKTDFFSSVSHEIKTPLAVIQNYAKALQNEALTAEERRDYTDTILASSKCLSALVTNMLKPNKLDKQTIQPLTKPYDVCRQLCETALYFESQWEEKNIEFIADIEERATIEADAASWSWCGATCLQTRSSIRPRAER